MEIYPKNESFTKKGDFDIWKIHSIVSARLLLRRQSDYYCWNPVVMTRREFYDPILKFERADVYKLLPPVIHRFQKVYFCKSWKYSLSSFSYTAEIYDM